MVQDLMHRFTHAAILGLLVGGGLGLPVPEELTQLTAGWLARGGRIGLPAALATCYAGVLAGDLLLFHLGRRLGPRALGSGPGARLLTPARRRAIEAHFQRHAFITVVTGRWASGLRLPFLTLAGASGMPVRTFVVADALAALGSVPVMVGLGWLLGARLEEVLADVRVAELALAALLAIAVAASVVVRRRRRSAAATPPPAP